jgi:hypothetical protein
MIAATRWLLRIAGVYGLIVLVPMYFFERKIGIDQPPAITHAEFFYGFLGVAIAWQVAFLIMSTDPIRYQPLLIAAVIEKFSFGIAAIVLFAYQRLAAQMLIAGLIDLTLGIGFLIASIGLRNRSQS